MAAVLAASSPNPATWRPAEAEAAAAGAGELILSDPEERNGRSGILKGASFLKLTGRNAGPPEPTALNGPNPSPPPRALFSGAELLPSFSGALEEPPPIQSWAELIQELLSPLPSASSR